MVFDPLSFLQAVLSLQLFYFSRLIFDLSITCDLSSFDTIPASCRVAVAIKAAALSDTPVRWATVDTFPGFKRACVF